MIHRILLQWQGFSTFQTGHLATSIWYGFYSATFMAIKVTRQFEIPHVKKVLCVFLFQRMN